MLSEHQKKIADEYEEIVTSMDDSVIIKTALKLAYQTATLFDAIDDDQSHPEDREEVVEFLYNCTQETADAFKRLVNKKF